MPDIVRNMASRVITQLISDLSGEEITGDAGETVSFSYRGSTYSIDLTEAEARNFDAVMATYLEHATQQGRRRSATKPSGSPSRSDAKAIREWAQAQGLDVPARGRIPAELREQYESAR